MGFISGAIITALVGAGAVALYKSSAEEKRRKNTPCHFNNGITKEEFKNIVASSCKSIKRINDFTVVGPIVTANVRSQSGITNWSFQIDFNDYGNITGKYWLSKGNYDSQIPSTVAERIKEEIVKTIK